LRPIDQLEAENAALERQIAELQRTTADLQQKVAISSKAPEPSGKNTEYR
jgi:hypothetical protein